MKNITKILLALMLCFVVVMAAVACDEGKTSGADAEKEATETLEDFMDAFTELDLDKAQDYVLDMDGKWDGIDSDYIAEQLMKSYGDNMPDGYEDETKDFFKKTIEKLAKDNLSYKIEETDVKGDDEVAFEVEFTLPELDFDFDGDAVPKKLLSIFTQEER